MAGHRIPVVRLLLVSTYELGHQPVHLASPTAALRAAGVDVAHLDLAVDPWDPSLIEDVDAVAVSVPMHTAMRLAAPVAESIDELRPGLPLAFYGLYAGVGAGHSRGDGIARFTGEYQAHLVEWAAAIGRGDPPSPMSTTTLGRSSFVTPDRSGLPGHDSYARLEWLGEARLAAAVEASHGCRHRCRHCPIPVVYDGRMRVVGQDVVLEDIDQLADVGVQHVTFADPDFLNAPRYSMDILRAAHSAHPDVTFDVTVKVEHVLRHRGLWAEAASLGVLFVVSAFESVDQRTLDVLDKSHTVADMAAAVSVLRTARIHVRPTWLPFFPWTTPGHVADLAAFLDAHELWPATDPVQLAIKLLVPEGSLLESHPAMAPHLRGYRESALSWEWDFEDEATAVLHSRLDGIAAEASDCGADAMGTLSTMRELILVADRRPVSPMPAASPVPRLSESWFCCAEPTLAQASAVGLRIGRVPLASG